jgi:hypothetical protein
MRSVFAWCALILLLAGCGTNTKSGAVGDKLSGGGVSVTLHRVDLHPPIPKHDMTGLSSPAPGDRLVGALVTVCSKHGAALGPYDFAIGLSGSNAGQVKFPSMNYSHGFDSVRTGCSTGWITFEFPSSSSPEEIRFAYDDTGSNAPEDQHPESHERFSWKLDE